MMKKWLTIAALIMLGWVASMSAQATDLELTGWPYQVDVVRENLGHFTSQSGLSATFNPFPSNKYHTKMVSSFASGTNFDVVYVRDSFLAEWAAAGWTGWGARGLAGQGRWQASTGQVIRSLHRAGRPNDPD